MVGISHNLNSHVRWTIHLKKNKMMNKRILIVCKGNICRSPLAHGLLDEKVEEHNLPWTIDSAGTGHWHIGKLPDERSIKVGYENDLDITYQRARQFGVADFDLFDLIYVMDKQNYAKLKEMAPRASDLEKVDLIMNEMTPGEDQDVPDPFHNGVANFYRVYKTLDNVTDCIIEKAIKESLVSA